MRRPATPESPDSLPDKDPARWLGGADDALAVDLDGESLTCAELRDRVHRTARTRSDTLVCAGAAPVQTIVDTIAGFVAGRPVLVADPRRPLAMPGPPPPGTSLLVTTSGSTGRPRLICRTLSSWTSSFEPFSQVTGITANDAVALTGPLHSSMQLFGALHALWAGAILTDRLDRATAAHAVPSVLDRMLRDGHAPDLAVVAGARLPARIATAATTAGVSVVEYYGAAELSLVAARRVPAGLTAFPGVEIVLRDGLVWVRSPYLAIGYLGDAGSLQRDDRGFVSVGDRAEWDGSTLRIIGRGDAAITTGGETVLAEDVEAVLGDLPGVTGVVVVGVPHPRLGEIVAAVVEFDGPPEQLRGHARSRLGSAARPRLWYATTLPRTGGGKPARAAVIALLRAGQLDDRRLPWSE